MTVGFAEECDEKLESYDLPAVRLTAVAAFDDLGFQELVGGLNSFAVVVEEVGTADKQVAWKASHGSIAVAEIEVVEDAELAELAGGLGKVSAVVENLNHTQDFVKDRESAGADMMRLADQTE